LVHVTGDVALSAVRELASQLRSETSSWFRRLEESGADPIRLSRATNLAASLTSTTQLFADVLDRAHAELRTFKSDRAAWEDVVRQNFEGTSDVSYISVLLKAWLFDVRALQDALGNLLSSMVGTGNQNSMESRLSKGDAVAEVIEEELPGYRDWFKEMRDLRNRLKVGDRNPAYEWNDEGITTVELAAFIPEESAQRMTFKEEISVGPFLYSGLSWSRHLMALAFPVLVRRRE
jgi:hypothetical protein